MKFDLEHDWQGNMSTPRKNLGEKTKLHLFFVLSLIFLLTGLIGHEPWRPLESTSISIILDIVQNNHIILPMAASEDFITNPPLYSYVGAAFGKLFSPILPLHDAARLSNAIEQLGETYEYKGEPNAALYFTDQYLPAGGFSLN